MTEKGAPRNDVRASVIAAYCCHCELKGVAIPGKQNSKIKKQNDRAKMKKQSAVS
jgi:hypothetical protein